MRKASFVIQHLRGAPLIVLVHGTTPVRFDDKVPASCPLTPDGGSVQNGLIVIVSGREGTREWINENQVSLVRVTATWLRRLLVYMLGKVKVNTWQQIGRKVTEPVEKDGW